MDNKETLSERKAKRTINDKRKQFGKTSPVTLELTLQQT